MEVLNENGEIKKIKRLAVKERGYRENKLSGRTKGRILLAHLTPTDCPLTRCEQSRIFPCWMLRAIPFSFFFRVRISSSTEKEIRTTRARHLRRRGFFFCFFFHIRFTWKWNKIFRGVAGRFRKCKFFVWDENKIFSRLHWRWKISKIIGHVTQIRMFFFFQSLTAMTWNKKQNK